jgi:hypothetical protein
MGIASLHPSYFLTILSRNFRHFEPFGVSVIDAFKRLPLE